MLITILIVYTVKISIKFLQTKRKNFHCFLKWFFFLQYIYFLFFILDLKQVALALLFNNNCCFYFGLESIESHLMISLYLVSRNDFAYLYKDFKGLLRVQCPYKSSREVSDFLPVVVLFMSYIFDIVIMVIAVLVVLEVVWLDVISFFCTCQLIQWKCIFTRRAITTMPNKWQLHSQ